VTRTSDTGHLLCFDGRFDPSTKINYKYYSIRGNENYYHITKDNSSAEELPLGLLSLREVELLTKSTKDEFIEQISTVLKQLASDNTPGLFFVGR
jgi:hypothetical protein